MQQVDWTLEFTQRKSNACHFCQHLLHLGIAFWGDEIISPSFRQHWEIRQWGKVFYDQILPERQ